jgi:hypothetical protein
MSTRESLLAARAEPLESPTSGVSWPAILAGAFGTAALSFILMALGAGVGLSSLSPWPTLGSSAHPVAAAALLWVILVQAISCALGGYLAGRLRTKWVTLHSHEVYFRDTAHGFLVWAVGLVISVFFLSSVGLSVAKDGANLGSQGRNDYFVDSLFRMEHPSSETMTDNAPREEAKAILARALVEQDMAAPDRRYLADLVAARTGLSQPLAESRVNDTLASARRSLDTARKAVAHSLYWLFAAFLIGAFCASFAATLGGKRRDLHS